MDINRWLISIADSGRNILNYVDYIERLKDSRKKPDKSIDKLCADLLSSKGEALGTALAREVVETYQRMKKTDQLYFFTLLLEEYNPNIEQVLERVDHIKIDSNPQTLQELSIVLESPRLELFKRINTAPNGTRTLVKMRCDLLGYIKEFPILKIVESDLKNLLSSWFNRGFLKIKRIDWKTPADILERMITYEAVHKMHGWDDLHRRLAHDRRCFAFFHPALPAEPLIFVEVALTKGLSCSIQQLLDSNINTDIDTDINTAIFYSISDCQNGLKGISFGNFLIKQVIMELQEELPMITQFATLSPIPGYCMWLKQLLSDFYRDSEISNTNNTVRSLITTEEAGILKNLAKNNWKMIITCPDSFKKLLERLCAYYLINVKKDMKPLDPVARFHLRNGAKIERLNWQGDVSQNGLRQSAGMLVNYSYDLNMVEKNHEAYINYNRIAISKSFKSIL